MATDDVGGVQYPRVKVSVGADGTATDVSSSNPMPVGVSSLPLPAGAATQATLQALLTELELKADLTQTQPVSGPLTDAQLRAAAVPVSGTITANTGLAQPLTDAQLRAAAVPVSAGALPLPAGAATETTLETLNTKIPTQAISGLLPVDTLGTPGVPRVQTTSGTAANIVLTTTCRRVSMFATQGTWYSISGAATATSHYIGAGERIDFDVPGSTTISVLQETAAGSIRITELV